MTTLTLRELTTILNAHAKFNAAHPPARLLRCHPDVLAALKARYEAPPVPGDPVAMLTAINIITHEEYAPGRWQLERSDGHVVAEGYTHNE